jgi:hypothetical protein
MPERLCAVLLFWIVKLSEVDPFSGMLAAPNTLLMAGGPRTVTLAFDVLPVPAFVEVTWTLLFFTPGVVPVTFKETVQDPPAGRLFPVSPTDEVPFVEVAVPLQVLVRLVGVADTSPAGIVSVNAIPFTNELVLPLLMVKVRLVVPFSGIVDAPKALAIVGGLMTLRLAEDRLPSPAFVESITTLLV